MQGAMQNPARGFEENLNTLFCSMFEGDALNRAVETLVLELYKVAGAYRL